MRIIKCLVLLVSILLSKSCKSLDDYKIVGTYKMDKFVVRDPSLKIEEYSLLSLFEDNTFELTRYGNSDKIMGRWHVVERRLKNKLLIEFVFSDKKVNGVLDGTIFYFDYPNDFHSGKFDRILYVKLLEN
jgi:hypothetical protein